MSIATSTSELWHALRGILCLHKPSGAVLKDVIKDVNDKVLKELNEANPEYAERLKLMQKIQNEQGLIDYSSHPFVLGDVYSDDDIVFQAVNNLNDFTSGISLVAVNANEDFEEIKNSVVLRQYLLKIELGKATDNSFSHGKVLEKSTYDHLKGRRSLIEKRLAQIRSSHQKTAFKQAGVHMQSKQAYNLAVKGLVRPIKEHEGYALIYGLECTHFKPPDVTLKVTCINESPVYLAEFAAELGLTLRTNAVLNGLQLIRYGPFSLENSLLLKHVNLENVIHNIYHNYTPLELIKNHRSKSLIYT